jgi:hypothetical protein
MISRRNMLAATAVGSVAVATTSPHAASFGNPDEPPQGAINTRGNPASLADPGPQNPVSGSQFLAFAPEAGKQKAALRDRFKSLILFRKFGAGEGIRTLDPNLGKVVR